jgi:uncharacterized protein YkwD
LTVRCYALKLRDFMRKSHKAALFATFLLMLVWAVPATASSGFSTTERVLLSEMNRVRASHGLIRLRLDWTLQRASRAHSADMLRRDYFAHGAFAVRLTRFGARGPRVGENLAWGVGARARARSIVRMWLNSPAHRRNLLRSGFRRVGVASLRGTFRGYRGARVVTADFAGT